MTCSTFTFGLLVEHRASFRSVTADELCSFLIMQLFQCGQYQRQHNWTDSNMNLHVEMDGKLHIFVLAGR